GTTAAEVLRESARFSGWGSRRDREPRRLYLSSAIGQRSGGGYFRAGMRRRDARTEFRALHVCRPAGLAFRPAPDRTVVYRGLRRRQDFRFHRRRRSVEAARRVHG